ncbi:MAG: hypothetical protein WBA51_17020 [Erythrobacter sp.]
MKPVDDFLKYDADLNLTHPNPSIPRRARTFGYWMVLFALLVLACFGLAALMMALVEVTGTDPLALGQFHWLVAIFNPKDWIEVSVTLLSLVAVAAIPIILERTRQSEARQREIARLVNVITDRYYYVEVLAVVWEITTKWVAWTGNEGDSYRVDVAGGMIVFEHRTFDGPEDAKTVPFQNQIRFQGHNEPLSGFAGREETAVFVPNEHMILTVWLSFWKEVERDIRHRRIEEEDAYERLQHLYSWFHELHQQMWMVEHILRTSGYSPQNPLKDLSEIASLEARFRRSAKKAGNNAGAFAVSDDNWRSAYKVAEMLWALKHPSTPVAQT